MLNNKITALYIRVSTAFQYEEGYSVPAQEKKLKQWCEFKDITNYKFYIDGGWSGSNLQRPEMQNLLQDIADGMIEQVVVYKLDRLSRSQRDVTYLIDDVFTANDVKLISISEQFDTSAYGKAMVGILSVFAQLERENIRERTRTGMAERLKKGYWRGGGNVPFGYDYSRDAKTLIPNEDAETVRQIFNLYLEGYSPNRLSEMFGLCGDCMVRNILDRITYTGKMLYKGEILDGIHEPLIDMETWEKAQIQRRLRSKTSEPKDPRYLFTGIIYCGKCGAKMRYQPWGKHTKIYCYSQQTSKKNLIVDPYCDNMRVNAEELEPMILESLFRWTDSICVTTNEAKAPPSGIHLLKSKYAELIAKLKRLYNLYGASGDEVLLETIGDVKLQIEILEKAIAEEERALKKLSEKDDEIQQFKSLRTQWPEMTMKERIHAIRCCIEKITVTDNQVDITFRG